VAIIAVTLLLVRQLSRRGSAMRADNCEQA